MRAIWVIGCADVGIDTEVAAQRRSPSVHRRARGDGITAEPGKPNRRRTHSRVGWAGTERAVVGSVAKEYVLRERIVEHAPASADDGCSLARQVVGKRNPRRKIVEVLVVQPRCPASTSHLH